MLLADRLPDQERIPHEDDPGDPGLRQRWHLPAPQALGVELEAERPEVVGPLVAMARDAAKPEFGVEFSRLRGGRAASREASGWGSRPDARPRRLIAAALPQKSPSGRSNV
jgi:hypothetical protein